MYTDEAAVELLIGHRRWLDRDDFVERFIETGDGLVSGEAMAWVDWRSAVAALDEGQLACCGSEAQLLRVAASVAEAIPVDLRDAVSGLDEANLTLVVGAVVHAAGFGGPPAGAGAAGTVTS